MVAREGDERVARGERLPDLVHRDVGVADVEQRGLELAPGEVPHEGVRVGDPGVSDTVTPDRVGVGRDAGAQLVQE